MAMYPVPILHTLVPSAFILALTGTASREDHPRESAEEAVNLRRGMVQQQLVKVGCIKSDAEVRYTFIDL